MTNEEKKKAACKKQMAYEAGLKTSADIIRSLGGRIHDTNPYKQAIPWKSRE